MEASARVLAGPGPRGHAKPVHRLPRALVVVNGRARGTGARALARATAVLARGFDVTTVAPDSHAALLELVAGSQHDVIVAVGGDGTVNAVASVLPAHAALAVLPIGTANDFAREVGVPRSAVAAAELLVARRDDPAQLVDVVEVNGRTFCTVGGIGLVTRISASVAELKDRPGIVRKAAQLVGGFVYKLSATATLLAGRDLVDRVAIRYRDPAGTWAEWEGRVHALFVVNHRLCGGGLAVPTGSDGRDGVFELGMVTAGSRPALIANFSRLSAGARISPEAFVVRRATEAVVRVDRPMTFAADGELLETAREFTLRIRPGALRVKGTRG